MDAEDIPFQILREITDGFSEERKLGQGAFGVVYKVKLGRLAFSLWTNRYSQQIWPAQCECFETIYGATAFCKTIYKHIKIGSTCTEY